MSTESQNTIYTIGHSTHPIGEFVEILAHYGIKLLADVRSLPGSRFAPQFNQENLSVSLRNADIEYLHLKGLGGRRKTSQNSPNTGWRNASFRGYADYMQTQDFWENLEILMQLAREKRTCIMCAEAVPWRCHRSLIGDALLLQQIKVIDIFSVKKTQDHRMTSFAKIEKDRIVYPPES